MIAVALTVVCAAAVAALLFCEAAAWDVGRHIAKPLAAAAFVGVAIARGGICDSAYASWMLVGLILGACGDVALMLRGRRAFVIGLGLFLFGHIAYMAGLAQIQPPGQWLGPRALLPILVASAAIAYLWPHLGRMRPVVLLYISAFVIVEAAALSAIDAGGVQGLLVAVGASSFFASDLAVARHRFVAPSLTNKLWGQPAYFAGQLLIAWSTGAS